MASSRFVVTVVWDLGPEDEGASEIRLEADQVVTVPTVGREAVRFLLRRSLVLEVPLAHYRGHRAEQETDLAEFEVACQAKRPRIGQPKNSTRYAKWFSDFQTERSALSFRVLASPDCIPNGCRCRPQSLVHLNLVAARTGGYFSSLAGRVLVCWRQSEFGQLKILGFEGKLRLFRKLGQMMLRQPLISFDRSGSCLSSSGIVGRVSILKAIRGNDQPSA